MNLREWLRQLWHRDPDLEDEVRDEQLAEEHGRPLGNVTPIREQEDDAA